MLASTGPPPPGPKKKTARSAGPPGPGIVAWARRMPDDGGCDCQAVGRSKSIDPAAPAACCELGAGSMRPAWGEIGAIASPLVAGAAGAACGAAEVSATAGGAA